MSQYEPPAYEKNAFHSVNSSLFPRNLTAEGRAEGTQSHTEIQTCRLKALRKVDACTKFKCAAGLRVRQSGSRSLARAKPATTRQHHITRLEAPLLYPPIDQTTTHPVRRKEEKEEER
jgi:hypothetical protein